MQSSSVVMDYEQVGVNVTQVTPWRGAEIEPKKKELFLMANSTQFHLVVVGTMHHLQKYLTITLFSIFMLLPPQLFLMVVSKQ